jgi:hypothetical protein
MTIYRNKKDDKLYLLYKIRGMLTGYKLRAEPYLHDGKIIKDAKMKNFVAVATR